MKRKDWLILLGAGAALVISLGILAFIFRAEFGYRTLGGPVAIVKGDPPKHGLLGVGFEADSAPLTIRNVLEESGAEEAGLQPGDVILSADQEKNPNLATLGNVLKTTSPGGKITLTIARGSDQIEVSVRLISFSEYVLLRERHGDHETAP